MALALTKMPMFPTDSGRHSHRMEFRRGTFVPRVTSHVTRSAPRAIYSVIRQNLRDDVQARAGWTRSWLNWLEAALGGND